MNGDDSKKFKVRFTTYWKNAFINKGLFKIIQQMNLQNSLLNLFFVYLFIY